jgi:hypothetical protein
MAANAVAEREFERAEENSEGSPIQMLEPALRRALSPSSRVDNKGGWPINEPPKKFLKNL